MDDQAQRDCATLVAQLAEVGNPGHPKRREVFPPPEYHSQTADPPVAYARGISMEHYGYEALNYGTTALEISRGPEIHQWGQGNPTRGHNSDDPNTWTDEFDDVDDMDTLYINPLTTVDG